LSRLARAPGLRHADRENPPGPRPMTNTIAFWLALIIAGIFAADLLFYDWDLHIILGRQVLRLIEWVAFWR
jgi:hypothetical protein